MWWGSGGDAGGDAWGHPWVLSPHSLRFHLTVPGPHLRPRCHVVTPEKGGEERKGGRKEGGEERKQ